MKINPTVPRWYSLIRRRAGRIVFLAAIATQGLAFLLSCGEGPTGVSKPLRIAVAGDTLIKIYDSLKVHVSVPEAVSNEVRYIWFIDDPFSVDTSFDSTIVATFSAADSGRHRFTVKAIDKNGAQSSSETLCFTVTFSRPSVTLLAAPFASAGVPFAIRFKGSDEDNRISHYTWYTGDSLKSMNTPDTIVTWTWKAADTGRHTIMARAIDRDGIRSLPDSLAVTVTLRRPILRPIGDTCVKVNDSLVLRFSAVSPDSSPIKYRFFIDNPKAWVVTGDSTLSLGWGIADSGRHTLVAEAVDDNAISSLPDTSIITVTFRRPTATLHIADTVVPAGDTLELVTEAFDGDGVIDHYLWSIHGSGAAWLITKSGTLPWVFGEKSEGFFTVRAAAVDNDGLVSDIDSARVRVVLVQPVVKIGPKDTTLYANRDLKVRAAVSDTNGPIAEYRWMVDGRPLKQWYKSDTIALRWGAAEAGVHRLSITVVANGSLESSPDSMLVRVLPGMPSVTAPPDTTVSSLDSVSIACRASDTNGTIVNYLWNISGETWDDSTTTPSRTLRYGGQGIVRVVIGARDNDGLVGTDTVRVTFNRPPCGLVMHSPGPHDTLKLFETPPRCTVSFSYGAVDSDNDSIAYSLSWGPSADSLTLVYEGKSTTAATSVARPGLYHWRLVAKDTWGNSISENGTVAIVKEYRICFIGHSIIVGYGTDTMSGGFRGGVLDSLRKTLGKYERLKAVGPCTTAYMRRSKIDDSCLAISTTTAREIYLLLANGNQRLVADIWVLMIGVNDAYSYTEQHYTLSLIDRMIGRNPQSRLYVLNGVPLPSNFVTHNYYLPIFNKFLADSVLDRSNKGAHAFLVDAYSRMSVNGQFDSTLFLDYAHPNPQGYGRLGELVYSSMKNSVPPAIPNE